MSKFKIYYGDGGVFEGEGAQDAIVAPKFDIQVIAQEAAGVGTETLHYFDYYLYYTDSNKWIGAYGIVPLVDQIVHRCPDIVAVGVGRMIHYDDFTKILKLARDEADPRKTAQHYGEEPHN